MATAISPGLTRALRKGTVATSTVPAPQEHVMRPLDAPAPQATQAQDTSELDRVFSALVLPSSEQASSEQAGAKADACGAAAPATARRRFRVDARDETSKSTAQTAPRSDLHSESLAQPWDERITERLAANAPGASGSAQGSNDQGRVPAGTRRFGVGASSTPAGVSRPWTNLSSEDDRRDVVSARKGMAAAKVLAPLVAAVSFRPGSAADSKERSAGLADLLVSVHQNAVKTAEGLSDALKEDVPSWMVTQLMASYASVVARRWERLGSVDPDSLGRAMAEVLGSNSDAVANLIRGAAEDAYIEVDGPDVARYRIAVSTTNAAWTLYDWVTHEQLSVDPAGSMPSEFFTYGLEASEIVNRLLVRCVDECRALVIQTDSADLRTAHMQSAIHRMSQLVGAEYVTQTRQIMNWIGEEGLSDQEFSARLRGASAELDSRILPHVFDWARVNFLRIEQGAVNAIAKLDEKARSARPESEGGGR